jgi:hypothetical protein
MTIEVNAIIFDRKKKYPERAIIWGIGALKKVFYAKGPAEYESSMKSALQINAQKEGYSVLGTQTHKVSEPSP